MAEEQKPPEYIRPTPEQLADLAAFTIGGPARMRQGDVVAIGDDIVSRWTSIPEDHAVYIALSRGDLDNLFFSITQSNAAILMLASAMRAMSFQDTEAANIAYRKGMDFAQSADSNFRMFFRAIMQKAQQNG